MATPSADLLAIGIDIGGTHILAVLVSSKGTVLCSSNVGITAEQRGDVSGIIRQIVASIEDVVDRWGASPTKKIKTDQGSGCAAEVAGIGIAVPGNVDPAKACTRYLPNFQWLEEVPLGKLITEGLKASEVIRSHALGNKLLAVLQTRRIEMRNDGRCAALAERFFGAGKSGDFPVFSLLTLGTGIGGALIYDATPGHGKLFDGCTFDAGDFGHHVICSGKEAFPCICGKAGCFETHASAAGLVRHYRALLPASSDAEKVSLDNAKHVVDLYHAGDSIGKQAWYNFLEDLSTGLANLVTFYNPAAIVLTGGLGRTPELYTEHEGKTLVERVDAKTLPATRGKCTILPGTLGADAGAIGAASLLFS